ncbi:MAG: glycosyl transferase, partial [Rhodobacteraceae bacterium]|nr:glycosyl transferase [Paracoccaceae bacterium]
FRFLTGRGRVGRRFAPRFWETESSLGRERVLMMLVCKKWHVAKRIADQVRSKTDIPAVEYIFNEAGGLPPMGGIETTLEKRNRHRRAIMRMLFDYHKSDKLLICLDPAAFDLMQDFVSDKAVTRILEVECSFSDDYLLGHARRVGLAGDRTPQEVIDRLLPTIRYDLRFESDRMRDARFPVFLQMRETESPESNAVALAQFLEIGQENAEQIARTDHLFAD